MTLNKARELLQVQVDFGGSYNRHSAKLILAEVVREHGRKAADDLIVELELNRVFDFVVGEEL
ncbi:hypothetical protein [Candidatus Spongiihabitans sp.]|uniref:hypothetical protein n=1 Tax=Candidatus Spongiihabitans sp. TaxID=3101308 RepID=UPI003C798B32